MDPNSYRMPLLTPMFTYTNVFNFETQLLRFKK